jgi:hypothetical protein
MCWNKDISLNTFLFSSFVLGLILYNNKYTRYKIKAFDDFWLVLFFMIFISVQFVEYFVWINLKNKWYNTFFSAILLFITIIQPLVSLMIIKNYNLRFYMIISYIIITISYISYIFSSNYSNLLNTVISKKGHLDWNYIHNDNIYLQYIVNLLWLFFFLFSLFYEKNYVGLMIGIGTFLVTLYNYSNDKSTGSIWCWVANSIMIYYAIYLLFYLPMTTT